MNTCRGPIRETRVPRYHAPKRACDCHTHIFDTSRYPLAEGTGYIPEQCTLADLDSMHQTLGIERSVIIQPGPYGLDNRFVVELCASRPEDTRGVVVIPSSTSVRELERLHACGIRGCRLTKAGKNVVGFEEMEALADAIRDFGWHLLIFAPPQELPELAPRLLRLRLPFVLDHLGKIPGAEGISSPGYATVLRLLDSGLCWVMLTGGYRWSGQPHPYEDMEPVIRGYCEHRPDRMLWGTDWPHPNFNRDVPVPNDGDLMDLVPLWMSDPKVQQQILVDNPAALYGFRD